MKIKSYLPLALPLIIVSGLLSSFVSPKDDFDNACKQILQQWYAEGQKHYKDVMQNKKLIIDGNTMPLYWRYYPYSKPEGGRALFISLHGGGGAEPEVNDEQWINQYRLYETKDDDVYLCPRAAFNTWDLHFRTEADPFYREIIHMAVTCMDVDPNKVYLLGYSAGGDGVWRLAPRHADMWAAASMMAGHPGDVSLVNLRNTPFMIWCGEYDEAYNRNKECAGRIQEMSKLHAQDSDGYIYSGHIVKNKGHWMDREDTAAIGWMYKYKRNPYPNRVVWQQEDFAVNEFYWLKVNPNEVERGKKVVASYSGNTIDIDYCDYRNLTIMLCDKMMNLDKPVVVNMCGKEVFRGMVSRSLDVYKRTLYERNDPEYAFSVEIKVKK